MKVLIYSKERVELGEFIEEIIDYLNTFGYEEWEMFSSFPDNEEFNELAQPIILEDMESTLKDYELIFSFSDEFFDLNREANNLIGLIKVDNNEGMISFTDFTYRDSLMFLGVFDVLEAMENDLKKFESGERKAPHKQVAKLRSSIQIVKKYIDEQN